VIWAPAIVVAAALVIIAAERRWPYDEQPLFRAGLGTDLIGYALIQSFVLTFVIGAMVRVLDRASAGAGHGMVSGWSVHAQLAFFVITHDFYIYWFHRLQHANPWLWRLHEAHHSAREVDWVAGSRSHALEIVINQTIEVGAMVLLGAAPGVIAAKGVISIVWGMWIHANVNARTGWLQYVINGPEMHRWHHALDVPMPGRNYGTKLAFWDYLFGTVYRPPGKPLAYGLAERFPRGFVAQQLFAFRRSR
jgi:sterol desaturase/sphingolipid hydroxylase (fatty acid hydroxylase superfamily)